MAWPTWCSFYQIFQTRFRKRPEVAERQLQQHIPMALWQRLCWAAGAPPHIAGGGALAAQNALSTQARITRGDTFISLLKTNILDEDIKDGIDDYYNNTLPGLPDLLVQFHLVLAVLQFPTNSQLTGVCSYGNGSVTRTERSHRTACSARIRVPSGPTSNLPMLGSTRAPSEGSMPN